MTEHSQAKSLLRWRRSPEVILQHMPCHFELVITYLRKRKKENVLGVSHGRSGNNNGSMQGMKMMPEAHIVRFRRRL